VRRILAIVCALALGACETPPINVDSAKAVIAQNETTKKHIKGFTEANERTQAHVQRVQEEALKERTSLETAKEYLEDLLGEQ
jgi:hypothetical protein